MIKKIFKYIWHLNINFQLRFRKFLKIKNDNYWSQYHINIPHRVDNKNDSINFFNLRNSEYPGYLDLMPVNNFDNKIILDYGCGPGHDVVGFIEYSKPKKVVAADISSKILRIAEKRIKFHENSKAVDFIKIDQNLLSSYEDSYFDVINCSGVLHHITDINLVLNEFNRVLKPRGELRVMVYHKDSVWYHLYAPYVLQIVEKMIPKNFDADEAFRVSTDGPNCPISKAYTYQEFKKIATKSKFTTDLIGVSGSKHEEMILKKHLNAAISDNRLALAHRDFLKNIMLNNSSSKFGMTFSGINLILKLTKNSNSDK